MKKRLFRVAIHVALFVGGLMTFSFVSAWGQAPALEAETKIWTRSMTLLDEDPEGKGKKEFDKTLAEQLDRWTSETNRIPLMKDGLFLSLDKKFSGQETPAKGLGVANDVMFERLKALATGRAERVVRYNAVLMIGDLNSFQKRGGGATTPYAKARPFLKEMAAGEDALLQIAAVKGLARHVECGIKSEEERNDLAKVFMAFAFAPLAKGEGNEAPEAQWNRLVALEALGNLGTPGKNGEIAKGLLESAARQNKDLENPYFRRDMDRRITAALAFAKVRLSADVLKAVGKKPTEVTAILYKLFLQCMIYEYNHDYILQDGVEGEVQRSPRERMMARTLTPEEEAYQIRLWKQRTKAISGTFAWIFNDKDSSIKKMNASDTKANKIGRQIRDISEMYDRAGLAARKRASRGEENAEEGMVAPETPTYATTDTRLTLYGMQKDMREALENVAIDMEIPVTIPRKPRPQMGY